MAMISVVILVVVAIFVVIPLVVVAFVIVEVLPIWPCADKETRPES